jgi:hypothetical protein
MEEGDQQTYSNCGSPIYAKVIEIYGFLVQLIQILYLDPSFLYNEVVCNHDTHKRLNKYSVG